MEIDKEKFNERFQEYINITDTQQANRYYGRYIHQDLLQLVDNVLAHWKFDNSRITRDDTESDLLLHILYKKSNGALSQYSGNWYNIMYTVLANKFRDICKLEKVKADKLQNMFQLSAEYMEHLEDEEKDIQSNIRLMATNNIIRFSTDVMTKKLQMLSKRLEDLSDLTSDERLRVQEIIDQGFGEVFTTLDPETGILYLNIIIHPELTKLIGNI